MAPTYQYKRDDDTIFELVQSIKDDPLMTCPTTGLGCRRVITGGHGALLPRLKTVRYRDGNMITPQMAKKLEVNPLYTTIEDKRKKLEANQEKARQFNAEQRRKITGRITEI